MTAVVARLAPGQPGGASGLRRTLVQHAVTVAAALFVSRRLGIIAQVPPVTVLALPPALLVLYLFLKHPKWCVLAIVATTFFGLYRHGVRIGPLTVRGNDLPLFFLIPWAMLLRARRTSRLSGVLAQQYIALFLGALGFTLFFALVRQPDDASALVVAWLRLISTFSLIWLVPYVIEETADVLFMLRGIAVVIGFELLWAMFRQPGVFTGQRMSGSNGPTVEGLLAAALLLMAIHSPVPKARSVRLAMFLLGGLSLYMTNSIGSFAAVGIVIGIFGFRPRTKGEAARKSRLLRPARILLLLLGVVGVLSTLRPADLPTSGSFKDSSAGSRLLVGIAGAKLFLSNPIFGVGWQRSSRPDVIASRALLDDLKREFPDFRAGFYPVEGRPPTVHNAYIQILAESGVIGGATLVVAALAVYRRIRRTITRLSGTAQATARLAAMLILATAIWLNDNPLFGAQPETVLLCTMLGLMATQATISRRQPHQETGGAPAGPGAGESNAPAGGRQAVAARNGRGMSPLAFS